MTRSELVRLARELNDVHHILPVPVAGKIPLGGEGWQLLPFETRMQLINDDRCTGVGIQCGLIFHPVLGPVELRGLDADIDDPQKSMLFKGTLQNYFTTESWRWGRRPATLVFTQPGIIKSEKFGPVQLLGNGKQIVYWGAYINKSPLWTDPAEYRHEGRDIFQVMPPFVKAADLTHALKSTLEIVGYPLVERKQGLDAVPLSTADLDMLSEAAVAKFGAEVKSMLLDVDQTATGTGRGTKLYHLGLKYGALIKASGNAPSLVEAAETMTSYVAFEQSQHALLGEIGRVAEQAFDVLPGTLGHGDKRDFARGVAASRGHSVQVAVQQQKSMLLPPVQPQLAGQSIKDLMKENLPPLRFLVNKYLPDSGLVVLCGKPKIGKGWIVLELALSVAEGGKFWNQQCEQGEVLLYMLEDGKRRMKERVGILRPFGEPDGLRFRYSQDGPYFVNPEGGGRLLEDIKAHIDHFPHIRLVIVDVLQRVRNDADKKGDAYQKDYNILGNIQRLAVQCNVLIIVVHHTKKGKVEDVIDSINGSHGISGCSDGSLIIGREGDVVIVEGRMRDMAEFKFDLVKEDGGPMWKPAQTFTEMVGPAEGSKTQSVVEALRKAACELKCGDISIRTHINEKNVATYLGRLERSNQIVRTSRGRYMAVNMKPRDRIEGVIDILRRCAKTPATIEVKAQYAPNFDLPPDVTYMMLTDVAIREIETGFADGKDILTSLKHRGLAVYNSDTLWLIGDKWHSGQPVMVQNPFAFKFPWEQ